MADEIKRTNTPTPTKQQPDPVEKGKKFSIKIDEKSQKPVIILESGGKQKTGTMNDDGTISFRKGGRVCKLAKRGKGRAYGKNS